MTHRKPGIENEKNIKAVCIWSQKNAGNSIYCDTNSTRSGFSKLEYMLEGKYLYVQVLAGMNPLFEDVLAVLLKDQQIQKDLRSFYEADHHSESNRESFYRIRVETGMSGCSYTYEDWAIMNNNSGLPEVNSKLLFTISSSGKFSELNISIASLYRFLLYKKNLLEKAFPDYECRFSRKNAARTLRENGTRVRYCWSPAKQYFAEAEEYTHVNEYTYKSLW